MNKFDRRERVIGYTALLILINFSLKEIKIFIYVFFNEKGYDLKNQYLPMIVYLACPHILKNIYCILIVKKEGKIRK